MDTKKNADQVWQEVETFFQARIPYDQRIRWQRSIENYRKGQISFLDLIDPMREDYQAKPFFDACEAEDHASRSPVSRQKGTRSQVLQVLAEIVTAHANRDPAVIRFRETVLGGTLLPEQEIQSWIAQQHEQEQGRPAFFLDAIPVPEGHVCHVEVSRGIIPEPPLCVGAEHPAGHLRFDLLEYATPEDTWTRRVPVAHGGVLASLRALSNTLAQQYTWQPAQATGFVLTGLPPTLRTIEATWVPSFFQTEQGTVTALSRVVLTLDPLLVPEEVSAVFQSIRQRLLRGAHWHESNERQLALVRFAGHRGVDEPWDQRRAAWNAEYPDWAYPEKTGRAHFKRDWQHALEKLLAPLGPGGLLMPPPTSSRPTPPPEGP